MDDVTPAPEIQDQSDVVEAPTPTVEPETFSKFSLNDVPEEHRPFVEQAYKQLQGDYTRKTQELATQRRFFENLTNEDTRGDALAKLTELVGGEQAILEALGYEVPDAEDNQDFSYEEQDPLEALRAEIAELKAAREQELMSRSEAQQMARIEASVDDQFKTLEEAGHSFDDADKRALVGLAISMFEPLQDGSPNLQAAFELDQQRWEARQKQYVQSKKSPQVSKVGSSAIPTPDLMDPNERVAWMLSQLEARSQ